MPFSIVRNDIARVHADVLVNAVIGEGLANFFELNEAIDELLHTGNVQAADGDAEALTVTDDGRHSAELLETTLPRSVREQAVNATLRLMKLARNRRQNHVQIDALPDGGCNVTFLLEDEKTEWMRLTVYVADRLQAETVRSKGYELLCMTDEIDEYIVEQLREQGMTIFLVEQNANQALKLADRGYVLENGHVVLSDTGDALLANEAVRSAYLGG